MRNEAAERLVLRFAWEDEVEDFQAMLGDALAAERKATVERIRAALNGVTFNDPGVRHHVFALLDAEAAR